MDLKTREVLENLSYSVAHVVVTHIQSITLPENWTDLNTGEVGGIAPEFSDEHGNHARSTGH